jgi:hypothetical protein
MNALALLVGATIMLVSATSPAAAQNPKLSADLEREVLATALAFYSPPRNQVRWIQSNDSALQRTLLARLGERFLAWNEDARGEGGRLRVSPIQIVEPGRYRLTVAYTHRTPYHEGPTSTQSFLVGCDGSACLILARGPGGGEDAW